MTVKEIEALFATKEYGYPKQVIGSIMAIPDGYIVYLTRNGLKRGDAVLDNEYFVDGKTSKITPFNLMISPKKLTDQYREALKKPMMYMRPGLLNM